MASDHLHRSFYGLDHDPIDEWRGGVPGKKPVTASLAGRPQTNIVFRVESAEAANALFGPRDPNGVAAGADAAVDRAAGSSGMALPDHLRGRFESSLGADLSSVRIHTGGESAEAASAVGAKAYTTGNDIHFNEGQYDPSSAFGVHLIAHEVAHTVQQAGSTPTRQHKLEVSAPQDSAEHEADRAADAMVAGSPATLGSTASALHRQPKDPSYSRGDKAPSSGGTMTALEFETECEVKKVNAMLKLQAAYHKMILTAVVADKKAKDAGFFEREKKNTALQVAKEAHSMAKELNELQIAIATISGSSWASKLEGAGKGLDKAGHVLNALETIGTIADTSALEALKNDPTEANAEAWANQVCACFDSASSLVDALPIEVGFIKEYFTGVLKSPRAFVKVFLSIMKRRYANIDKETGVSAGGDSYGKWKGESYVLGAAADGPQHDLYVWMLANMEIDGHDIQKCTIALARDLFCSQIVRDPSVSDEAKARWLHHLKGGKA